MNDFAEILDLLVRHRIYLQRVSEQQAIEFITAISGASRAVVGLLVEKLDGILERGTFTVAQRKLIDQLQRDLAEVMRTAYGKAEAQMAKSMGQLLDHEIDTTATILKSGMDAAGAAKVVLPTATVMSRIVENAPFAGYTMGSWFKNLERKQTEQLMSRVRIGIANGETTDQIVRAIRGTRAAGYQDGLLQVNTSTARMYARTITNGVANQAHQELYKANSNLIAYEIFQATLDGRTSEVCASLDGQKFSEGEGPVPPMHPNCRSLRVPVTKAMAEQGLIGDRPYVTDSRTRAEREKDLRAEAHRLAGDDKWKSMTPKQRNAAIADLRRKWQAANIGMTSAKTSYQKWLKEQPAWFQKEVLGPTRYALFKKGGLSLTSFVDNNYHAYTIEQLMARDREAFKRAGLI